MYCTLCSIGSGASQSPPRRKRRGGGRRGAGQAEERGCEARARHGPEDQLHS